MVYYPQSFRIFLAFPLPHPQAIFNCLFASLFSLAARDNNRFPLAAKGFGFYIDFFHN